MFLEFLAPDWPLQNPKRGFKASEGLYKIPTCSNLGCPPRFLTHVLDFGEASLVFNTCLGFCRGPHPPPKHCQSFPILVKAIKKQTRFPWCVLFSVKGVLNWNVYPKIQLFLRERAPGARFERKSRQSKSCKSQFHERTSFKTGWFKWMFVRAYCFLNVF